MRFVVSFEFLFALTLLTQLFMPVLAADLKPDVIYQIITDRFANGRKDNDDPPQSPGMFDASMSNWHAYWGGDLSGITEKLPYIKELGATAIWISPVSDNINKPINDADNVMNAPYHGYHTRDFKRIEEHFGDPSNSWSDFDKLTRAAHELGIKVIIDLPPNHTSQYNHGEFGALYDKGTYKGDCENDRNKYFHHLPQVTNWTDRYELQYGTIFYLSDLNQENTFVDDYLKTAAELFADHGADGTRLDTSKHTTWGWQHTLANHLFNKSDHVVFGEWWMDGIVDSLYPDAAKFSNTSGIQLLDFPLAIGIRKVFSDDKGELAELDSIIEREYETFDDANKLVTFFENHDMPRFLNLTKDQRKQDLATAFLLTCRGTPVLYYGSEQYLHNDTKSGADPYNRQWMSSFDTKSTGFQLIKRLNELRTAHQALRFGDFKRIYVTADVYIFERSFGGDTVVVAINKSATKPFDASSVSMPLPKGSYRDDLNSLLSGKNLDLSAEKLPQSLVLPPQSVSMWSTTATSTANGSDTATGSALGSTTGAGSNIGTTGGTTSSASMPPEVVPARPEIASVHPSVINGGVPVAISGAGFGTQRGKLIVGTEEIPASTWTPTSIKFYAPSLLSGKQNLKVVTANGASSNSKVLRLLEGKLIPIKIIVKGTKLNPDEQLFVTGNVANLGNWKKTWDDAAGPLLFTEDHDYGLCVPLPANRNLELKLFVLDRNGKVLREQKSVSKYRTPNSGPWTHEVVWD